jgi:hypothetical protein
LVLILFFKRVNNRNELLPILGSSSLISPGAALDSDGVHEISSIDGDSDSESVDDENDKKEDDNEAERARKEKELESLTGHIVDQAAYEKQLKRLGLKSTNDSSSDSDNSDDDSPPKKRLKSAKKSKYRPPQNKRKSSFISDSMELKNKLIELKMRKAAIKQAAIESESRRQENEYKLARQKLELEHLRLTMQSNRNHDTRPPTPSSLQTLLQNTSYSDNLSETPFSWTESLNGNEDLNLESMNMK